MFLSRGVTVHRCTYVCTLACILTDWMKGFLSILLYYVFFKYAYLVRLQVLLARY